ncbi:hypothetical protein Emed_005976 [Eimeria media]
MRNDGRNLFRCLGRSCWERESPPRLLVRFCLLLFLPLSSCSSFNGAEAAGEGSVASLPYEATTNDGSNLSAASFLHAGERGDATMTEIQGLTASTFHSFDPSLRPSDEGLVEAQQQDDASAAAAAAAAAAQLEASGAIPAAAADSQASPPAAAAVLRRRLIPAVLLLVLVGLGVARTMSKKPRQKEEEKVDEKTEMALLEALERLGELVPLLRPAQQLAEQLSHPDASKALLEFEQNIADAKAVYSQFHQRRMPAALALDSLEPVLAGATSAARQLQRIARLESAQVFDNMEKAAASLELLPKPVIDLLENSIGPDYALGLNRYLQSLKETVDDLMQRSQDVYCRVSNSNKLLSAGADLRFLDAAASHMVFAVRQWRQAVEDSTKITKNVLVRSIASKSLAAALIYVAQHGALEAASRQLAAQEEAAGEEGEGAAERQELRHAIDRSMEVLSKSHKLLEELKANLHALQTKTHLSDLLIAFQATEVAAISTESYLDTNLERLRSFPLLRDKFYLHLGEGFKRKAERTKKRAPAAVQLASMLREAMYAELGEYTSPDTPSQFVNEEIFKVLLEAADTTFERTRKIESEAASLVHAISTRQSGKRMSDLVARANSLANLMDDTSSDAEKLWLKGRLVKLLETDMHESFKAASRATSKKSAFSEDLATLTRDMKKAAADAQGVPSAAKIAEAAARMRLAAHYIFLITSGTDLTGKTTNQR